MQVRSLPIVSGRRWMMRGDLAGRCWRQSHATLRESNDMAESLNFASTIYVVSSHFPPGYVYCFFYFVAVGHVRLVRAFETLNFATSTSSQAALKQIQQPQPPRTRHTPPDAGKHKSRQVLLTELIDIRARRYKILIRESRKKSEKSSREDIGGEGTLLGERQIKRNIQPNARPTRSPST